MIDARPAAEIRPDRLRAGFTLVELLVVIAIIALLAALITPAVIGARTSARNAAIKAEIDMLHMAIMNYKNEYGSFPPCVPGSNDILAIKHLQRLFPRMTEKPFDLKNLTNGLDPSNALTRWLFGYTDNPSLPITGGARKKLYDFDQARIAANGTYFPSGKKESTYYFIDSASYSSIPYTSEQVPGAHYMPKSPPPLTGKSSDFMNPTNDPTRVFLNPETFQILCAGLDEVFGTDDDLSNCWSGTRKQYLDSLRQ